METWMSQNLSRGSDTLDCRSPVLGAFPPASACLQVPGVRHSACHRLTGLGNFVCFQPSAGDMHTDLPFVGFGMTDRQVQSQDQQR